MDKQYFSKKLYLVGMFLTLMLYIYSATGSVVFNNINNVYGLSVRGGVSICKDEDGFIWASHKTGIVRLTNDSYKFYHLPSEIADYTTIKLIYNNSILIAYTNNGQIFQFNQIAERFELMYNLKKILLNNYLSLNAIFIQNSQLWVATSNGFYKIKDGRIEMFETISAIPQLISSYNKDHIFIGCEHKILVFNTTTDSVENIIQLNGKDDLRISSLLFLNQKQQLWIGTIADGLYRYSIKENRCEIVNQKRIPRQPILDIEYGSETTIFIGVDGQGMWEMNIDDLSISNIYKESVDDPTSLKGNGVYDIFNDENKRIWVTTYTNGISYFDNTYPQIDHLVHQNNNPNSLINNNVNSIVEDRLGRLWIGTSGGLSTWNMTNDKWINYYLNDEGRVPVFLTLCEDKNEKIWAGTYASGVYVIDTNNGEEIFHYSSKDKQSAFNTDFVLDIFKDSRQNLWIGGVHGYVTEYLIDESRFVNYGRSPLNGFAELKGQKILLACTFGLSVIEKETSSSKIILNGYVVNDVLGEDSIIWACTSGNGLLKYNYEKGEIQEITMEDGLPSNYLNSIVKRDKYFWIGTEHGICKFNSINQEIETFNGIPLIANLSFNRNASCLLRDGRIAFGSNNGFIIFDPENLKSTELEGELYIQDISILGRSIKTTPDFNLEKPVDVLEKLNLRYHQNTISIEVLPIEAIPGAKITWKMEGVDEEWSVPSDLRKITYSNLPSKTLKLSIRLLDNTLKEIIDERVLTIKVAPPFWRTWYFFVSTFLVVSGIIYFLLWYYINRIKQKHNEEKIEFFTTTAHDIRTSLTLIQGPVDEILRDKGISKSSKYFLSLAKKQTGHLVAMVNQLMDFEKVDTGKGQLVVANVDIVNLVRNRISMFKSYALNRKITIHFKTNHKEIIAAIDEGKIEKVVDNLLSNAIKYSHQVSDVQIELNSIDKECILKVIDRGIGISKSDQKNLFRQFYRGKNAINNKIVGSGIGLLLVKNYIHMHAGKVFYKENEMGGSIFSIVFPIKNVDKNSVESSEKISVDTHTSDEILTGNENVQTHYTKAEIKILIVDDNEDLREYLRQALQNEFLIMEAEDGVVAWSSVQQEEPDIVISDIMMPNMDGFEFCEKMKSNIHTSHIPLILFSALTAKVEQLNGLGLGADDYITKPFDIEVLKQKIRSIIQNRIKMRVLMMKIVEEKDYEPLSSNDLNVSFAKRLIDVVRENIDNTEFNRDLFAQLMHVSTSLLYKKVKAITNESPTDFIRNIRLNHAVTLIKTGRYTMTEISEKCGFANPSYFSTAFKKQYGKSPKDFK